jgi:hypothetical protein
MSNGTQPGVLFKRYATLLVGKQDVNNRAIDLSQLRFRFRITNNDIDTPNICIVRVYNLKDQTVNRIINEYTSVSLDAGYETYHSIIFTGNIKRFVKGKENNTDSFLEIQAGDTDYGYATGVINRTFAAETTFQQELQAYASAMGITVDPSSLQYAMKKSGGIIPNRRGKVVMGMARDQVGELSKRLNAHWSIQNGVLFLIPLDGYLPGEIYNINSLTGMIGIPQATLEGINVRVLLDPRIRIGRLIHLNEKDITQTMIESYGFPAYKAPPEQSLIATADKNGLYKVLVAEQSGDTRGQEWYTDLVCLALDNLPQPVNRGVEK